MNAEHGLRTCREDRELQAERMYRLGVPADIIARETGIPQKKLRTTGA